MTTNAITNSATARAHPQPLLKSEDIQRLLRVSGRTVARMCERGQLPPPIKVGGGNRWKPEDVMVLLDRSACSAE